MKHKIYQTLCMFSALLASTIKLLVLNIKVSIQDQKFLPLIEFEYLFENLKKTIEKYVNLQKMYVILQLSQTVKEYCT